MSHLQQQTIAIELCATCGLMMLLADMLNDVCFQAF